LGGEENLTLISTCGDYYSITESMIKTKNFPFYYQIRRSEKVVVHVETRITINNKWWPSNGACSIVK